MPEWVKRMRINEQTVPDGVKQPIVEIANHLPADCTWDKAMHQLYVRQKLRRGWRMPKLVALFRK